MHEDSAGNSIPYQHLASIKRTNSTFIPRISCFPGAGSPYYRGGSAPCNSAAGTVSVQSDKCNPRDRNL